MEHVQHVSCLCVAYRLCMEEILSKFRGVVVRGLIVWGLVVRGELSVGELSWGEWNKCKMLYVGERTFPPRISHPPGQLNHRTTHPLDNSPPDNHSLDNFFSYFE